MKTAQQAFDETMNSLTIESNKELLELSAKIDEAAKNGNFYISGTGWFNVYTTYELNKLGYSISQDMYNGRKYYFISWFMCDIDNKSNTTKTQEITCNKPTNNSNKNVGYAIGIILGLLLNIVTVVLFNS